MFLLSSEETAGKTFYCFIPDIECDRVSEKSPCERCQRKKRECDLYQFKHDRPQPTEKRKVVFMDPAQLERWERYEKGDNLTREYGGNHSSLSDGFNSSSAEPRVSPEPPSTVLYGWLGFEGFNPWEFA